MLDSGPFIVSESSIEEGKGQIMSGVKRGEIILGFLRERKRTIAVS